MYVAIRQIVCAMLAVGMFLAPRMGSAQERAQVPAGRQQAQTGEMSAELAQFEKDVAQLRGPQSAPATPANPGMRLNVGSLATLLDGRVAAEGITTQATSFVVWLQNLTSSYVTTRLYWRDVYSSEIRQTQAGVSPGQVVPHITSDCGAVTAYILDVYVDGLFVASTGATEPVSTDGDPCADAWDIK